MPGVSGMRRNATGSVVRLGAPGRPASYARAAVLIDLENLLRRNGEWITTAEAERVLATAMYLAGAAEFRLAVAPATVLRRYVDVLVRVGLPCEHVTPGPDAADLVLLEHERHLTERGYTRFAVVSGDHIFSDICRRHPTTVIVRRDQPVARALRETAIAVLAA
jgi:hypothetical protein